MANERHTFTLDTTEAQRQAERLRDRIIELEQSLADLKASQHVGGEFLAQETADLERQLSRAQAALGKMNLAMGEGEESQRRFGSSTLQLSYAFQDLFSQQGDLLRGFMAIQNNMPGIIMSLGGTAGLAGSIGAVSMATALAMPAVAHFIEQLKLFGSESKEAKTALDRLQERIKEISAQSVKLAVDRIELEAAEAQVKRIKEGMAAFEKAGLVRPEEEREAGQIAATTLAEVPGGEMAARDRLLATMVRRDQERSIIIREAEAKEKVARQRIEELEAPATGFETGYEAIQIGVLEDQIKKARKSADDARLRIEEAAKVEIGKLLEETERGDQAALTRLIGLARETGDERMKDLADALADASAERLKQYDEKVREFDAENEKAKMARELRAMERRRVNRELAEQGRQQEPSPEELSALQFQNEAERKRQGQWTPLERERIVSDWQRQQNEEATRLDERTRAEEVKRINNALGERATLSFEAEAARQNALRAMGERALPEAEVQRRGQAILAAEFQRLGATPGAAAEAASQARDRANADLATRQARLAEQNLNTQQIAVLNVEALMMEQQRLAERQNTLDQVVRFQQTRIQASQRTAQKIRQGGGG